MQTLDRKIHPLEGYVALAERTLGLYPNVYRFDRLGLYLPQARFTNTYPNPIDLDALLKNPGRAEVVLDRLDRDFSRFRTRGLEVIGQAYGLEDGTVLSLELIADRMKLTRHYVNTLHRTTLLSVGSYFRNQLRGKDTWLNRDKVRHLFS